MGAHRPQVHRGGGQPGRAVRRPKLEAEKEQNGKHPQQLKALQRGINRNPGQLSRI